MIIFKCVVAALDIIFFMIFAAFILTLDRKEVKSNPVAAAFFVLAILTFAANAFLIFTM